MRAIEAAKLHLASQGRREVEVPEWGEEPGKPLIVTFTPLTVAEHRKLFPAGKSPDAQLFVDTLIQKAKDADGKPMFTFDDRHALMTEVDSGVIARVAGAILATAPSEGEAAKN